MSNTVFHLVLFQWVSSWQLLHALVWPCSTIGKGGTSFNVLSLSWEYKYLIIMCMPTPGIWGMKRNGRWDAWMFIDGTTNKYIRTGLPNAFFVPWFPSGPQWKQCCWASNTHMLPDASESQKQELGALLVSVPPPNYTAWLQNMQTDRASLDSLVCFHASDASPQLQTELSQPFPLQSQQAQCM